MFRTLVLALATLLLGTGCASLRPRPAGEPARRLVLALDGIDYRDVVTAREAGLFGGFRTPSRLISTFPSISDIAWHDIFGVLPPAGYQRVYYSHTRNSVVGGALDAIRPIEYEQRMDLAFGEKLHHLGAYLMAGTVSRREANVTVEKFWRFTDRHTVYVYNVGPDALQHTRGDVVAYLRHLDGRLGALQREYRERVGRDLEIVILSDHGHNRALTARFLPLVPALEALGFRISESIDGPRDVAFSVDGVTTGFGVFTHPGMRDSVARTIARLDGVDLVSVYDGSSRLSVYGGREASERTRGTIEFVRTGAPTTDRYRYTPAAIDDPLGYRGVVDALRGNAVTGDGFAPDSVWVRATRGARFPAAPPRIVRGHLDVTRNPAPILVSVHQDYRVGLGAVSIANRMRPLGGTHGALDTTSALGVLMTNFVDTHDGLTSAARGQLGGFDDLRDRTAKLPPLRLVDASLLARDRLSDFRTIADRADVAPVMIGSGDATRSVPVDVRAGADALRDSTRTSRPPIPLAYEVRLPGDARWSADSATLVVSWERMHGGSRDARTRRVAVDSVALATMQRSADGRRVLVPVHPELRGPLVPRAEYRLTLLLRRRGDSKRLGSLTVFTDGSGIPRVD